MRLFRREGDRPEINGLSAEKAGKVVVNIDVRRVDRQTRKVKIIVAATWAAETLFKADYMSEVKNDMQAVTEARIIAEAYCKHEDYVISSVDTTGADLPVVQTIVGGSRW